MGDTYGLMPATPVTMAAPSCSRCSWVTVAPGHAMLKMVSGGCSEHAVGAVRWDYQRWIAQHVLRRTGRISRTGEPGPLAFLAPVQRS